MLDPAVKILTIMSAVGADPKTLLPTDNIVTTYKVGTHGPFTIATPKDRYTIEYLAEETGKMVNTLRAAGAIT